MTAAWMRTAGLLTVAMAMSAPAWAQGPGPRPAMVAVNCEAEIAKHCADVQHGRGAVPACLEKHVDELSDACKTALETRAQHRRRMQQGN